MKYFCYAWCFAWSVIGLACPFIAIYLAYEGPFVSERWAYPRGASAEETFGINVLAWLIGVMTTLFSIWACQLPTRNVASGR